MHLKHQATEHHTSAKPALKALRPLTSLELGKIISRKVFCKIKRQIFHVIDGIPYLR